MHVNMPGDVTLYLLHPITTYLIKIWKNNFKFELEDTTLGDTLVLHSHQHFVLQFKT